jgi:hypothetical protein
MRWLMIVRAPRAPRERALVRACLASEEAATCLAIWAAVAAVDLAGIAVTAAENKQAPGACPTQEVRQRDRPSLSPGGPLLDRSGRDVSVGTHREAGLVPARDAVKQQEVVRPSHRPRELHPRHCCPARTTKRTVPRRRASFGAA